MIKNLTHLLDDLICEQRDKFIINNKYSERDNKELWHNKYNEYMTRYYKRKVYQEYKHLNFTPNEVFNLKFFNFFSRYASLYHNIDLGYEHINLKRIKDES